MRQVLQDRVLKDLQESLDQQVLLDLRASKGLLVLLVQQVHKE